MDKLLTQYIQWIIVGTCTYNVPWELLDIPVFFLQRYIHCFSICQVVLFLPIGKNIEIYILVMTFQQCLFWQCIQCGWNHRKMRLMLSL